MIRVKSLMRQVNPVPPETAAGLAPRGAAGAGVPGTGEGLPGRARRPRRRGLLVAALAAGAAVVAAAVAVPVLWENGTDGPEGLLADEPYYATTGELEGAADLIVRARLDSARETQEQGFPATVATADIAATAKGRAPGRTVRISYTRPDSGPEAPDLAVGRSYVLLLERQDDGLYTPVNSTQGSYRVTAQRAQAGADNDVALSEATLTALGLTG
ncbi:MULTISPECIES: hypothetical protein [Streptomyces]|uniref:Uncharacterized protein n=2 Tax=Streptomyces TaxID=1883 RepID=A0A3R7HM80_9ACTN|nr:MULTISPECIES: hypothetical protein [Streptomyces]KNE84099.1 hypothetical protein ADZ36_02150 [Streptomyces fradiae]OFA59580.1 hypothetical protein BEN35_02215 [Streptomyces fradiae]PQM24786.1 hypothetical protein Sfr7A_00855 [Streptomyces xinghaiensis]RKM98840.1 hypothetical protein SFRA_000855 [Streptomyces xinghaiensis]RNC76260.1 hypothetical protein DC095_003520 [Streptomyces xinghaiensis]